MYGAQIFIAQYKSPNPSPTILALTNGVNLDGVEVPMTEKLQRQLYEYERALESPEVPFAMPAADRNRRGWAAWGLTRRAMVVGGAAFAAIAGAALLTRSSIGVDKRGRSAKSTGAESPFTRTKPIRDLYGHTGRINAVAFSPDSYYGLSGSADRSARLWDIETGETVRTFFAETPVLAVAFSPDGKTILTGGEKVTVWNADTGDRIRVWQASDWFPSIAVLPDGKTALSASVDEITVWDLSSGKSVRTFPIMGFVGFSAVSPDGRLTLVTYYPGATKVKDFVEIQLGERPANLLLLDLENGAIRWSAKSTTTGGAIFSRDGRLAIVPGKKTEVWDIESGKLARRLSLPRTRSVAALPDGLRAVSTYSETELMPTNRMVLDDLIFGKHDTYRVEAGIRVWDIEKGTTTARLYEYPAWEDGKLGAPDAVAVSDDGQWVLSAGLDRILRLWHVGRNT